MGELRIGDRERELAMAALDEHLRAGRLDPTEYAERSATASTARVRSQLDELFTDLPAPHPVYPTERHVPDGPGTDHTGTDHTGTDHTPGPPDDPGRTDDLPELVAPIGAVLGCNAGKLSALVPVVVIVLEALVGFRFPFGFLLIPLALAGLGWLGHRYGG